MADAPGGPPVWEDGQWTPLPALDGDLDCDSCVVGLGGSGLTAVHALLARGESVVGLDAHDVAAGAAGRNGGFLLAGAYDFYHDAVRLHGRERARAIYALTREEIARIAAAAPGTVRHTGSRRLAASPAEVEDCRAQLAALHADGWPAEWREDADGVGLFLPDDAAFQPLARCRRLARAAVAGGARLFARTPVLDLRGAGHAGPAPVPRAARVVTATGTVRCRRVIVAVDGGLERLLPELAGRVRTARLQMLATAPTTERTVPCPMYHREGFEYWQQLPDGAIALGGFRDRGGEGEWTTDATPGEPVQGLLERFLRETLRVSAPITHRWAARAGYSVDGLPVLAELRDGAWAIGGYSGTGNVIGALLARAVVAAALDGDRTLATTLAG